jgi:hypothetical protein
MGGNKITVITVFSKRILEPEQIKVVIYIFALHYNQLN